MVGRSSGEGDTQTPARRNYKMISDDLGKRVKKGGLLAAILIILVAVFLWLFRPLSFICTDEDLCKETEPIRLPAQP